ncbi:MAG: hypothetical protein GY811_16400 [Myxococcales bacterium]|nr:hypothetical protein [Myxococcales bacterium]
MAQLVWLVERGSFACSAEVISLPKLHSLATSPVAFMLQIAGAFKSISWRDSEMNVSLCLFGPTTTT